MMRNSIELRVRRFADIQRKSVAEHAFWRWAMLKRKGKRFYARQHIIML